MAGELPKGSLKVASAEDQGRIGVLMIFTPSVRNTFVERTGELRVPVPDEETGASEPLPHCQAGPGFV